MFAICHCNADDFSDEPDFSIVYYLLSKTYSLVEVII